MKFTNDVRGKIEDLLERGIISRNNTHERAEDLLFKYGIIALVLATSGLSYAMLNSSNKDEVTIAKVIDLPEDEYNGKIPVVHLDSKGNEEYTTMIPEGEMVVALNEIDPLRFDKMIPIITSDGEASVSTKYLEAVTTIPNTYLKKYNEIYEVFSQKEVQLRKEPQLEDDVQENIGEGEFILGASEPIFVEDNEVPWIKCLYVSGDGTIEEGYADFDSLRKVRNVKKTAYERAVESVSSKLKRVVDTSKDGVNFLRLRNTPGVEEDNIILTIPNGSVVSLINSKEEQGNWVQVQYNDGSGKVIKGWVSKNYLMPYTEKEMMVSKKLKTFLNLREEPSISSDVVAKIQKGTKLKIADVDLEHTKTADNITWVKVRLNDKVEGYVSNEYLVDIDEKEKDNKTFFDFASKFFSGKADGSDNIVENIKKNPMVNKSGNVIGIDSRDITGEQLEDLIEAGIPKSINGGSINTEDISGKIGFVYIRLGVSATSSKDLKILDSQFEETKQQIETCEKLGIPYGLYYYSTSIDEKEAKQEASRIKKSFNEVLEGAQYNVLPFAIDVELSDNFQNDRQYGNDVTKAKATLAKEIKNTVGESILYVQGRTFIDGSSEKIFDLEKYCDMVGKDVKVWFPIARNSDGSESGIGVDYMNTADERTGGVILKQTILDCYLNDKKGNLIPSAVDIDFTTEEKFLELLDYAEKGKSSKILGLDR